MAYINIGTEGHRPVGPLGIKKAEQELIKRRYKQQHYVQSPEMQEAMNAANGPQLRVSQNYDANGSPREKEPRQYISPNQYYHYMQGGNSGANG
jgi:hypothetical protein